VQVRHKYITRLAQQSRFSRVRPTGMFRFIAVPRRDRKRLIQPADLPQMVSRVDDVVGHHMDDAAFRLDFATANEELRAKEDRPVLLEERRPDHKVGDVVFIFERDEHDAPLAEPGL
jgi:hypothetical protein